MKIAISAGDPSGDEHAAKIVSAVKALEPEAEFFGMGGTHLREVGVRTVVDSETEASVMGAFDVIRSLGKLRGAFRKLEQALKEEKPDILVLVDYQDFNTLLARAAKKLGIKTFFFIAPSVWAWRPGRVKHFVNYIDHLACIFPFEPEVFSNLGYDNVTFVGHPFTDNPEQFEKTDEKVKELREELSISDGQPTVALFPGSRMQEIRFLLKEELAGFRDVAKKVPDLAAVLPVPPSINISEIQDQIGTSDNIHVLKNRSLDALMVADCGIIKSGTSNLQAAMMGLPFSMIYRAGPLMAFVVRNFVAINNYSIVNIIRKNTVREITRPTEVNRKVLAEEMESLLFDEGRRAELTKALSEVKAYLKPESKSGTTASRVAQLILEK